MCTVYSMTRTVIGGPGALAGRVQLHEVAAVGEHPGRGQREGPRRTPRPATGCARRWRAHRGPGSGTGSCGRPAPASQARTPPAGLVPRSASPSVQDPKVAPTSAPVPDSAAGSQRTCRNAPARVAFEGRPKYAAFSVVSGTSLVVPSIDTTRSPQQNTPAAPTGPALESKGTDTRRVAARSTLQVAVAVAGEPGVRSSPPTARCPCSSAGCHPRWRADPDPAGVIGIRDEPCSDPSFPRSVRRGLLRDALNHVRQTHQRTSGVPGCRPSVLPRIPGCERHRDRRSRSVFPTAARDVEVCDRAGMARRDHVARPSRPPSIAR